MSSQTEITEKGLLLDDKGRLIKKGWARKPYLKYNRENLGKGWFRTKEWDYYAILHPDFGLGITITDLGIMGIYNITWLDFKKKTFHPNEETKLFTRGKTNLPLSSEYGDVHYKGKSLEISIKKKKDKRIIEIDYPAFEKGKGLKGNLELFQDPKMDSMVIHTPWKNKPKCFYYNHKVNCMPVDGNLNFGGKEYKFNPESSFAVLDWGRGIWPYSDTWYWGSASGKQGKDTIGFNIGYGFGETSAASENIFYLNGVGHKLDQVEFIIDKESFLKPWKFKSNDGRFEMDFQPILDRSGIVNLVIFKSVQHQVFGYFSGKVVLDNGVVYEITNLLGFAEEVQNRW